MNRLTGTSTPQYGRLHRRTGADGHVRGLQIPRASGNRERGRPRAVTDNLRRHPVASLRDRRT